MSVFMVERDLKGISIEAIGGGQKGGNQQGCGDEGGGLEHSLSRSTFAPEDGRCMCLFEASSEAEVKRLNERRTCPIIGSFPPWT